jgi:gentisate 1,2-dioxygenase
MMWLDGLDTPLVRMLEAGFDEEYHQDPGRCLCMRRVLPRRLQWAPIS